MSAGPADQTRQQHFRVCSAEECYSFAIKFFAEPTKVVDFTIKNNLASSRHMDHRLMAER